MNLAICDDIDKDREHIRELLLRYLRQHDITAPIYTFSSGEEFLSSSGITFDAVFMDIFMGSVNGLETAKLYPDKKCRFIFITTTPDFALNAFSVNVVHYLLKPVTYEGIAEAMRRCFPSLSAPGPVIHIKQKRLTVPIYQNEIIHAEVFGNNLVIHTTQKDIEVRMPLKTFYEQLDSAVFIRPQRSHIINMNYIEEIAADNIRLPNDAVIYISREQMSEIRKKYETFLFNKIREENDP